MAEPEKPGKRPLGHTLIAIGKLLKVLTLLTVACLALAMVGHDPPQKLQHWSEMLGVAPGSRHLHRLVGKLAGVGPHKLEAIGLGAFVYAAVFAVEGIGLWLQKWWAEYLTIIVTISFIPFEVYEIAHQPHAGRIVTLVLNVAAVIYLVIRVRHERHGGRDRKRTSAALRPSHA